MSFNGQQPLIIYLSLLIEDLNKYLYLVVIRYLAIVVGVHHQVFKDGVDLQNKAVNITLLLAHLLH